MSANVGSNDEKGAQALLDLRYGSGDATIRCTTPVKYPSVEDLVLGRALNESISSVDNVWWKYVLDKTGQWSIDKMADQPPKRKHANSIAHAHRLPNPIFIGVRNRPFCSVKS